LPGASVAISRAFAGFSNGEEWDGDNSAAWPATRKAVDHYLRNRLFYDCAGWSGPDMPPSGAPKWVRIGMAELPVSQLVFATDYPQAVRDTDEVLAYVDAVRALGAEARTVLNAKCGGAHSEPARSAKGTLRLTRGRSKSSD